MQANIKQLPNKTINSLFLFSLLFACLYFPKFGMIDFSVIGIFVGTLYLLIKKEKIKLYLAYRDILFIVFFILVYTFVIYSININDTASNFTILRMIRTTIFLSFFTVLFSNIYISTKNFINILLILLLVNSIFVLVEVFLPSTQNILAYLTGYNKTFYYLRGFGLIGSFDGAGILSLSGLILLYLLMYKNNKVSILYIFYWIIFSASAVLTGRTYMFLLLIVNIIALSIFLIKGKRKHKLFAIIISLAFLMIFLLYILPLLILTLNAFGFDFSSIYGATEGIDRSFNIANTSVYSELLVFPEGLKNIFLGSANSPITDYGFLMQWHMVGIVGILVILFFYTYLIVKIYHVFKASSNIEINILNSFFIFYTLLLIIGNLKVLFIFGRTISDVHWILFAFILSQRKSLTYEK